MDYFVIIGSFWLGRRIVLCTAREPPPYKGIANTRGIIQVRHIIACALFQEIAVLPIRREVPCFRKEVPMRQATTIDAAKKIGVGHTANVLCHMAWLDVRPVRLYTDKINVIRAGRITTGGGSIFLATQVRRSAYVGIIAIIATTVLGTAAASNANLPAGRLCRRKAVSNKIALTTRAPDGTRSRAVTKEVS